MIAGWPIARLIALLCAVLVLTSTAYTAHAMAETYLHANAVSHSASALTGLSHDHDTQDVSDKHHDDDHHEGDAQHDDESPQPHGAVGHHHHHADHNLDTASLADHFTGSVSQPFERVRVRLVDVATSMPPDGIERPPRA